MVAQEDRSEATQERTATETETETVMAITGTVEDHTPMIVQMDRFHPLLDLLIMLRFVLWLAVSGLFSMNA